MPQEGAEEDDTMTRRRRHTPDQIIRKLAEGNKRLAGGSELDEVCRHLEITESTRDRWVDIGRMSTYPFRGMMPDA